MTDSWLAHGLKLRPIDNLPLFHVARPRHDGPPKYGKRLSDLVFGTVALAVASPVLLAAAVAIKLDNGGAGVLPAGPSGLSGSAVPDHQLDH